MNERWDGNVHYFDYTPDSLERWSNRDAMTVAKAFIYSNDGQNNIGIIILVSGRDLMISQVSPDQAIQKGAKLRDELIGQHKQDAQNLKENRILLYSWDGQKIQ